MTRLIATLSLITPSLHAQSPVVQQRLGTLRAAYEEDYQKTVAAVHQQSVADLDAKYTSALDRALATATQAGQLDTALALRDESKRLKEGRPLPADDFAAPETLKTLRLTYRSALANLAVKRDQLAAPVKARYDAVLETLQRELTKMGDLDGALAAKTARSTLKSESSPMPPPPPHSASPIEPEIATPKAAVFDLSGQVWENDLSTVYLEAGGTGRRVGKKSGETEVLLWEYVAPNQYKLTVPSNERKNRLWTLNEKHTQAASKTMDGSSGNSTMIRIK